MEFQPSTNQQYTYTPLPSPGHSIRLLNILPYDEHGNVNLALKIVALDDFDNQYDAISYVWGSSDNLKPAVIDGQKVQLRHNLWRFLKYCRDTKFREEHHQNLWIDAICINQIDPVEKSSQVQQMGQIFAKARVVFSWLGEASERSVVAQYQHEYDFECQMSAEEMISQAKHDLQDYKAAERNDPPSKFRERLAAALLPVVADNYWSRLWVVQEICLARAQCIITAVGLIPRKIFLEFKAHYARAFMPEYRIEKRAFLWVPEDIIRRRVCQLGDIDRFMTLSLVLFEDGEAQAFYIACSWLIDFSCQDLRDRVYGVLGIIRAAGAFHDDFHVDYAENATGLIQRIFNFLAVRKVPFQLYYLSELAFSMDVVPGRAIMHQCPPPPQQPGHIYHVKMEVLPSLGFYSKHCRQHESISGWGACFHSQDYVALHTCICPCGSPWPGEPDYSDAAGGDAHERILLKLHSALNEFMFLLFSRPSNNHAAVAAIAVRHGPEANSFRSVTSSALSGSLRDDLCAFLAQSEDPFELGEEDDCNLITVDLRPESLAQIYEMGKEQHPDGAFSSRHSRGIEG